MIVVIFSSVQISREFVVARVLRLSSRSVTQNTYEYLANKGSSGYGLHGAAGRLSQLLLWVLAHNGWASRAL